MVDCGIVKEMSCQLISQATCLAPTIISKACARQRMGRAGRVSDGICYRLYSDTEYNSMIEFSLPEIMKIPLNEVCLTTKMLAGNLSIAEFLGGALDPPSMTQIRDSIDVLKKINALDMSENLTCLGNHLAHLPVDCQLGKTILYSIILQCIDPVVTIVSAMSVHDPFKLPAEDQEIATEDIKKKFSENSLSDHRVLLNVYEAWVNHTNKSRFCAQSAILNRNMEGIKRVRQFILRHLNIAKYTNDGDWNNLNINSLKWEVVKSCLMAGLYRE